MSNVQHWGEFSTQKSSDFTPDVTADIERSMDNFFLDEYESDESYQNVESVSLPMKDPLVFQAISLHKYAVNIAEQIETGVINKQAEEVPMSLPEVTPNAFVQTNSGFNRMPSELEPCPEIEVPTLSKTTVRQALAKSVAIILAHMGYETSQQSALDMMTDVLEEFLKKICHSYKLALEDDQKDMAGFPQPIERTLTELGFGGMKGLQDFYHSRVVKYVSVLHKRCKDLDEQYQLLQKPKCISPVDKINKMVRVKVEEEEDVVEIENPEGHFSTIDGHMNFSILETGYQLLNSLEAEANLQSLGEGEEEQVTVKSESPAVVQASAATVENESISHLSMFNKKKRNIHQFPWNIQNLPSVKADPGFGECKYMASKSSVIKGMNISDESFRKKSAWILNL